VICRRPPQVLMRVVAGNATDSRINPVVTTAVKDPIGLEAYVVQPSLRRQLHHLVETAMTKPAELLPQRRRLELAGIEDFRIFKFSVLHRGNVLRAWSVAGFAGDAADQVFQVESLARDALRRVTLEATPSVILSERTAQGLFERRGCRR